MSNRRFYWLKLKENFFSEKAIKKLRKIAGGDTYTIIYLKLLLKSMSTEGRLYFDGIEDTFCEELALDIDEDTDNVKLTVMYLKKSGLLKEVNEQEIELIQINEMIGSETAVAERVRKHREIRRNKEILLQSNALALPRNTNETNCNTEIEKEIDIDKDIEIEKDIDKDIEKEEIEQSKGKVKNAKSVSPPTFNKKNEDVRILYNTNCFNLPSTKHLSIKRDKQISLLFKRGYTLNDFKKVFENAQNSKFLCGENDRNWKANFDWLIIENNFLKVLEGNYENSQTSRYKNQYNNSQYGTPGIYGLNPNDIEDPSTDPKDWLGDFCG